MGVQWFAVMIDHAVPLWDTDRIVPFLWLPGVALPEDNVRHRCRKNIAAHSNSQWIQWREPSKAEAVSQLFSLARSFSCAPVRESSSSGVVTNMLFVSPAAG